MRIGRWNCSDALLEWDCCGGEKGNGTYRLLGRFVLFEQECDLDLRLAAAAAAALRLERVTGVGEGSWELALLSSTL